MQWFNEISICAVPSVYYKQTFKCVEILCMLKLHHYSITHNHQLLQNCTNHNIIVIISSCKSRKQLNKKKPTRGLTVIAASMHGLLRPTCNHNHKLLASTSSVEIKCSGFWWHEHFANFEVTWLPTGGGFRNLPPKSCRLHPILS